MTTSFRPSEASAMTVPAVVYFPQQDSHLRVGILPRRMMPDPPWSEVPRLLAPGGTPVLVHSELAGVETFLRALRLAGLLAGVASQVIPFGPALSVRAGWLERTGRLGPGCRPERLVVIRADAA